MNELERLTDVCIAQEEIIDKQKEIIDSLFLLLMQHISAEAEELKPIIEMINEAAGQGRVYDNARAKTDV